MITSEHFDKLLESIDRQGQEDRASIDLRRIEPQLWEFLRAMLESRADEMVKEATSAMTLAKLAGASVSDQLANHFFGAMSGAFTIGWLTGRKYQVELTEEAFVRLDNAQQQREAGEP